MIGKISKEALECYNSMCVDGIDFAEEESYDFARCVMPNGDIYGTKGQCKVGKPISDKKVEKKGDTSARMAKLKRAFLKKIGREMRPQELVKAQNMLASIGVPIPAGESAESMLQKMLPKGEKVVPVKTA